MTITDTLRRLLGAPASFEVDVIVNDLRNDWRAAHQGMRIIAGLPVLPDWDVRRDVCAVYRNLALIRNSCTRSLELLGARVPEEV
jgi:hypothetical protein